MKHVKRGSVEASKHYHVMHEKKEILRWVWQVWNEIFITSKFSQRDFCGNEKPFSVEKHFPQRPSKAQYFFIQEAVWFPVALGELAWDDDFVLKQREALNTTNAFIYTYTYIKNPNSCFWKNGTKDGEFSMSSSKSMFFSWDLLWPCHPTRSRSR